MATFPIQGGGGGGSGFPIGSVAVIFHQNRDIEEPADGTAWLRSGVVITSPELDDYPDAITNQGYFRDVTYTSTGNTATIQFADSNGAGLIVGRESGNMQFSTDGGENWTDCTGTNGDDYQAEEAAGTWIVTDSTTSSVIRSTDGQTFSAAVALPGASVASAAPRTAIGGDGQGNWITGGKDNAMGSPAVWLSVDDGLSWSLNGAYNPVVENPADQVKTSFSVANPDNTGNFVCAYQERTSNEYQSLMTTTDGGTSWTNNRMNDLITAAEEDGSLKVGFLSTASGGLNQGRPVWISQLSRWYWMVKDSTNTVIWISDDLGVTWSVLAANITGTEDTHYPRVKSDRWILFTSEVFDTQTEQWFEATGANTDRQILNVDTGHYDEVSNRIIEAGTSASTQNASFVLLNAGTERPVLTGPGTQNESNTRYVRIG